MGRGTKVAAFAVLAAAACAWPRAAVASYVVEGCALDDGAPAPAAGWTFAAATTWGRGSATCGDPSDALPSLSAWMDWNTYWFGRLGGSTSSSASWTFTAPPDTLIEGFQIHRYEDSSFTGVVPGVFGEVRWEDSDGPLDAGCTAVAQCSSHGTEAPSGRLSSANLEQADGLAVRWLRVSAVCTAVVTAETACPTAGDVRRGRFRIFASRIRLRDLVAPTVLAAPSGGLFEPGRPIDGERTVHVTASDRGGGVARAVLYADGRAVADVPPDGPGCAPPAALVPCPLRASFTVVLDTRTLPDGPHALQLRIADAGGNETTAGTAAITIQNVPTPTPTPTPTPAPALAEPVHAAAPVAPAPARFAPLAAHTVAYGAEPLLRGHLVGAAAPISVAFRVARAGAPWQEQGTLEPDAGGGFALRVPAGPTRELRLRAGAAELTTRVVVRAGIDLQAVRRHGRVTLSGRLRGGPGRLGTRVELTASGHRSGVVVRCDALGRFRARAKPAAAFTARLLPRSGYPYAAASQRTRTRTAR